MYVSRAVSPTLRFIYVTVLLAIWNRVAMLCSNSVRETTMIIVKVSWFAVNSIHLILHKQRFPNASIKRQIHWIEMKISGENITLLWSCITADNHHHKPHVHVIIIFNKRYIHLNKSTDVTFKFILYRVILKLHS